MLVVFDQGDGDASPRQGYGKAKRLRAAPGDGGGFG